MNKKYNLVKELLGINSNIDNLYYCPLGPVLDSIIKGNTKYEFGFYVEDDVDKPKELSQRIDYFWGKENVKKLYYEHPIFPGIKAKMLFSNDGKYPKLIVNKNFYKFSKFRFENVLPPGQHLTNLIIASLLENNITTFHCASFSNPKTKEGYLVFGASNTGKSFTTFRAVNEDGYQYHSEDLTILDINHIYTTPLLSVQSSHLPNKNWQLKYNLLTYRLTGINFILPRLHNTESFREYFKDKDVNATSNPKKIFILERGEESVTKLSKKEGLRRIIILNKLEFLYLRDQMLLTYSIFNKEFDMQKIIENEKEMTEKIVNSCDVYLVKANNPRNFYKLIKTKIEK